MRNRSKTAASLNRYNGFRFLLYAIAVLFIVVVYLRVVLMAEGLRILDTPCNPNHVWANAYRIPEGEKVLPDQILGDWECAGQLTYWGADENNLYYYRDDYMVNEREVWRITEDTIVLMDYPFEQIYAHPIRLTLDSLLMPIDSDLDRYCGNEFAYRMKGDTLILVEMPEGHCRYVEHTYFLRSQKEQHILDDIALNKINHSHIVCAKWKLAKKNDSLPPLMDLRYSENYRLVNDSLTYQWNKSSINFRVESFGLGTLYLDWSHGDTIFNVAYVKTDD